MTYIQDKATRDGIDANVSRLSDALREFPRGPNGLTPDDVKFSIQYRQTKAEFDAAFMRLRAFNTWFVRRYAQEIKADRSAGFRGRTWRQP